MRRLAWSLFGLYGAIVVFGGALVFVEAMSAEFFVSVPLAGFALVGTLVVARDRKNWIGWILLALAFAAAIEIFAEGYVKSDDDPASLPGGVFAGWLTSWFWFAWLVLAAIFVPLFFPDGRLPSPRWRPLLWCAIAALALSCAGDAFKPGPLPDVVVDDLDNPVGIAGAAEALRWIGRIGTAGLLIGYAGAGLSLIVRFRRAGGLERQQIKWFAYVAGLMLAGLGVALTDTVLGRWTHVPGVVGWLTFLAAAGVGLPAAIAIAVFRYRLYDIDVVINRTLVYGSVTALLAGGYLGLVLFFQFAFQPVTEGSGLAVALSTLAVAALFRPARSRIQALVDRRFYRSKYDAQRTLEGFASRLREEVDLDSLRAELTGVVAETMQPAHVSLWLREAGR